ncbi:MAG: 23S rRNA (guanosine(2251)-2'-O)-methyltransferase RlmB [Eubacterium sp.]|nr:23S rRNA (guanosine(2251)-2'-O)-methyltransferase RlmB [Eubacterium sp.]
MEHNKFKDNKYDKDNRKSVRNNSGKGRYENRKKRFDNMDSKESQAAGYVSEKADKLNDIENAEESGFATEFAEGRNAVVEAIRSDRTVEKVFIQEGIQDGSISTILKEVKKRNIIYSFVSKQRLDQMSETGRYQGVIAKLAEFSYAEMDDIFKKAEEKGEDPFVFILDEIEDPHNLGAIIRTANLSGAHGVIIPKHRAAGLSGTAVRASAGAVFYTPVVKVTNIAKTIDELKDRGIWFACADMNGQPMYDCNLKGPLGLVIGNEGSGVSRLVKEKCDYIVSIPMSGDIDSLNASVAAGVLAFEVVRQRMGK